MRADFNTEFNLILQIQDIGEKITSLNEFCYRLRYANPNLVLEAAQEALRLSKDTKNSFGENVARMNLAFANFILSKDYPILKELTEARFFFENEKNVPEYPIVLNYLANVNDNYGEYQKGLALCHEALNYSRELNLKEVEADIWSTIGLIMSRISDCSGAIESFNKSYILREESGNFAAMASSLNLLARTYALDNQFQLSEEYYQKAIKLRIEINEIRALPWSYLGLASLYEKKKDFQEAEIYYNKSCELNTENSDKRCQLHCYLGLSKIYLENGSFEKALDFIEKTIQIAQELSANPILYEAYEILSKYYEKTGNINEAFENFKKFHQLRESVLNAQTHSMLKNQQMSFEIEKVQKDAEIYQLRNIALKNAYNALEAQNNDIINSIDYAKNIQQALLPPLKYFFSEVPNSFIFYKPKAIVSGDFYWCYSNGSNTYVAAADCTGHGVPGGFMSILGISLLNEIVNSSKSFSTDELLNQLRTKIIISLRQSDLFETVKDGMDISLCRIDWEKNELEFSGAFNSLYIVSENKLSEIKADRMPIGIFSERCEPFSRKRMIIEKNTTIYLFSDGFADQFGGVEGKKLKMKGFKELLLNISKEPVNLQNKLLEDALNQWKGSNEQVDDILIIGIKF